jgi:hypothetical protein
MKPLNLALVLAIGAAALFTLLHSHWVSEIAEDTVEAGLGVKDLDWVGATHCFPINSASILILQHLR